MATVQEHI